MLMSAISTNSRSRIRLTSFEGSAAVGLNGPAAEMAGIWVGGGRGVLAVDTLDAAAASSSSPELPVAEGEKIGSWWIADVTMVEVPDAKPVWRGGIVVVR